MIFTTEKSLEELNLEGARYVFQTVANKRPIRFNGVSSNQGDAYDFMVLGLENFLPNLRNISGLEKKEFGLCNCELLETEEGYKVRGVLIAYSKESPKKRNHKKGNYIFTTERKFLDLEEIKEKYKVVNSENRGSVVVEGEGDSFSEAYENMIRNSSNLADNSENSPKFRGLELGIYDCHSQTIGRKKIVSGLLFCMKSTSNPQELDTQPTQHSSYQ